MSKNVMVKPTVNLHPTESTEHHSSKAIMLKQYLQTEDKPARIEVIDYTQRFKGDVDEIKKMKVALDPKSHFYIKIQFFTDESDKTAPLIAQISFIELPSQNLIKEESLNLD
jgi:hypothetical protein